MTNHLTPKKIIRFPERTHTYRIFQTLRLRAATSGKIKVAGFWVRKPNSTDLPVEDLLCQQVPAPILVIEAVEGRLARHGAWLGTAVLLIRGTIPRT